MVLDKQSMEQTFGEVISQLYYLSLSIKCLARPEDWAGLSRRRDAFPVDIRIFGVPISWNSKGCDRYIHMLKGIVGTMAIEKMGLIQAA
jgi:hypothetical protein